MAFVVSTSETRAAEKAGKSPAIAELRQGIEEILEETKTPGAGVAIVSRDKIEWTAGIGKADVAANKPATDETLFRIGSVSKGFAALAALQLQEQGKLTLTDTVKKWVPDVAFTNPWESTNPVRLVHLMEHTTGFDDMHLREYALSDPAPIALNDALAYGASSRVSRWPPGSRMSYCNSGPAVLAAVIEKVTGQRFEDYVQEHFFKPLHMDTASYFYTPEVQQRLATLYHNDGITSYPYWHIDYRPAGAINASAKDMANYVRFYLQRGSFDGLQLLRPSSIERMETPTSLPAAKLGPFAGYGLYNYATCDGPFVFHGHNGGVMGGLTEMAYLPEYGRGYALMINSGNVTTLNRIATLLRHYVTRELTPPPFPPRKLVPADVQKHYTGYYENISPRQQRTQALIRLITVRKIDFTTNGFYTTIYGLHREHWLAVTDQLFRKADESAATFALLPDDNGQVLAQTAFGTYKKVSALRVWGQLAALVFLCLMIASSVLFALVRVALKFFGKPLTAPNYIHRLPSLCFVLLGIFFGLFWVSKGDIMLLGTPSWIAIGILLTSLALPITTAASVFVLVWKRSAPMNRIVYWHSVLATIAAVMVAAYMGYWGLFGLCLWG